MDLFSLIPEIEQQAASEALAAHHQRRAEYRRQVADIPLRRSYQQMLDSVKDWQLPELPDLSRFDEVIIDHESTGLAWWRDDVIIGTGIWTPDGVTRYLPIRHKLGPNIPIEQYHEWCRRELRGKRVVNIRTKFDLHLFRQEGIDLDAQRCTFGDVAHYAALLDDHRKTFNQKDLVAAFLGSEAGKMTETDGFQLDAGRFAEYPAGLVARRAEHDVLMVALLQQAMWPQLTEQNLHRVREVEDGVIPVVVEMEHNGAPIDVERLNLWCEQSERDVQQCLMDIKRMTGVLLDTPNKRDDIMRMFRAINIDPPKAAATDKDSIADDLLAEIQHPVIPVLRKAIAIASLRSKFLLKYQRSVAGNGILRYELHQLPYEREKKDGTGQGGAVSGRFSSAAMQYYDKDGRQKKDGGNIQQVFGVKSQYSVKRDFNPTQDYIVRKLFVPDRQANPGAGWFKADMEQIEYRRFVALSGSERLIQSYRDDPKTDYHVMVHGLIVQHTGKDFERTHVKNLNFACVSIDTPVLTSDLRWVAAGNLQVGDELLAFDEHQQEGRGRAAARRWQRSVVTHNEVKLRECLAVELTNGDTIITTPEHPWLTYDWHGRGVWLTSQELRPGRDLVVQATQVWNETLSKDAGWLAGFFDGEGCSAKGTVTVNQNPGALLNRCSQSLQNFGFPFHVHPRKGAEKSRGNNTIGLNLQGNVSDRLRFLGEIRPERLLERFVRELPGVMFQARERVGVVRVRPAGECSIAALSTTSATYIAGGYAMHNSLYGAGLLKIAFMVGEINESTYEELKDVQYQKGGYKIVQADARIANTKSLYETYHAMFPEVKSMLRLAAHVAMPGCRKAFQREGTYRANSCDHRGLEEVAHRGHVETILGRRARFRENDRFYSALNRVIQGTAADDNKVALIDVYRSRKVLGFIPRFTVHDELCGDLLDPGSLPQMAQFLNTPRLECAVPILWAANVGPSWAESK